MSTEVSSQITRKSASNLALAFILLPERKRDAMSALYAFCREVDDVADEDSVSIPERRKSLAAWRQDIQAACRGDSPLMPVNRELQPFIREFGLRQELFEALLDGVEMDLETLRYPDYATLERYCYHVASVVGLLSIEIFGYRDPHCRDYAVALGKALQFTNILRDVGNDSLRGRIYLPQEELDRCGVRAEDVLNRRASTEFGRVCEAVFARAKGFYGEARRLLPEGDRKAMVAAELMGSVYWRLLAKLEREGFPVLDHRPVRLGKGLKLGLIFLAWCRVKTGLPFAAYGDRYRFKKDPPDCQRRRLRDVEVDKSGH